MENMTAGYALRLLTGEEDGEGSVYSPMVDFPAIIEELEAQYREAMERAIQATLKNQGFPGLGEMQQDGQDAVVIPCK